MTRFYIRHCTNPVIEVDIEQITTYGDREATVAGLVKVINDTPSYLKQLGIASNLPLTLHLPDGITPLRPGLPLNELSVGTTDARPLIIKQKGVSLLNLLLTR